MVSPESVSYLSKARKLMTMLSAVAATNNWNPQQDGTVAEVFKAILPRLGKKYVDNPSKVDKTSYTTILNLLAKNP
jgi:hypothetical protein